MDQSAPKKIYNLDIRTFKFSKNVRVFVRNLPRTITNISDAKQLIRSSGSVGANYLEASESLSKKDFILRLKISRKEAKESMYWLQLLDTGEGLEEERSNLIQECNELMKIFGSIITKTSR